MKLELGETCTVIQTKPKITTGGPATLSSVGLLTRHKIILKNINYCIVPSVEYLKAVQKPLFIYGELLQLSARSFSWMKIAAAYLDTDAGRACN